MAKYDVTYSCGHTDVVQLYGKTADRERELRKMSGRLCPDCYKKWVDKVNAQQAAEILGELQLPELTGTEKQIAYAKSLRDAYITEDGADEISNAEVFDESGKPVPFWIIKCNDYVKRLDHLLHHLSDDEAARFAKICEKHGVTADEWCENVIKSVPKAYACLTETNAGKLIYILKAEKEDCWEPAYDEKALYITPEELIAKYDLHINEAGNVAYSPRGKEKAKNDKNLIAVIEHIDEIKAILKSRNRLN